MAIGQAKVQFLQEQCGSILSRFLSAANNSSGDFAAVEEAARSAILALRPVLMSAGLQTSAAASAQRYCCSRCQRPLTPHSRRERQVVTSEGEARFTSVRYRCRTCGEDYYPLEMANGLRFSQYTTGAKGLIAATSVELAYSRASQVLAERGVSVSPKEVDRIVGQVADWREAEERAAVHQRFARGKRAASTAPALHNWGGWEKDAPAILSVDGGKVRSPESGAEGLEWFECRVGLIAPAVEHDGARPFLAGGVQDPDKLFRLLASGCCSDPNPKRRSLFIADGATWIWWRASMFFPDACQVLDIYHASEHVASAAAACWGEKSERASEWRRRARAMLLEPDGPQRIRQTLREELDTGHPHCLKDLQREIAYLETHKERMPYAQLKAEGLPIGSGVMESAIKQTTTQRLRRPGMMWTKRGADKMIRLRTTLLGGDLTATIHRMRSALQTEAFRHALPIAA